MTYSESEWEADPNFAINSASDFDSDSDSDSDSSSVFMNLLILFSLLCSYNLPEKLADNFSFPFS